MVTHKEKSIFDNLGKLLTYILAGLFSVALVSLSHAQESECKNALEEAAQMFDNKDYSRVVDKFINCPVNLYEGKKKKRVYKMLAESVGQVLKNKDYARVHVIFKKYRAADFAADKNQKKVLSTALQQWIDDEWPSVDTGGVISITDTTRLYYEVLAEACIRVDSTKKANKIITAFAKLESYVPPTNWTKFKIYFLLAKKKLPEPDDCENALEQAVERFDVADYGGVLDKLEPCLYRFENIQKGRAYKILTKSTVQVYHDSAYKKDRFLRIITILEKYPPAVYATADMDEQHKNEVLKTLAKSIERELVRRDSNGAISIADITGLHYYEMLAEAYIETEKEKEARELIKAMVLLVGYKPDLKMRSDKFLEIFREEKPRSLGWWFKRAGIVAGLGVAGIASVYSVTRGPEQLPGPPGSPDSMLEQDVKNSKTSLWIGGGIGVAAVSTVALLLTRDRRETGAPTLSKLTNSKSMRLKNNIP